MFVYTPLTVFKNLVNSKQSAPLRRKVMKRATKRMWWRCLQLIRHGKTIQICQEKMLIKRKLSTKRVPRKSIFPPRDSSIFPYQLIRVHVVSVCFGRHREAFPTPTTQGEPEQEAFIRNRGKWKFSTNFQIQNQSFSDCCCEKNILCWFSEFFWKIRKFSRFNFFFAKFWKYFFLFLNF